MELQNVTEKVRFYWPISLRFLVQRWSIAESASPCSAVRHKSANRETSDYKEESTSKAASGSSLYIVASSYPVADLAAHCEGGEAPSEEAIFIQMAHIYLHATVVLGSDQLVGPGAA